METIERQAVPVVRSHSANAGTVVSLRGETSPSSPARPRGLLAALRQAVAGRRLFILAPTAMILGELTALADGVSPSPAVLIAGGLVAAAGLLGTRTRDSQRHAVVLFAWFWLGLALLPMHGVLNGTQMLFRPAYGTYTVHIDSIVSEIDGDLRVIVSDVVAEEGSRAVPIRRARLVLDGAPDVAPGDTVRGRMRFYSVPGPVVPGGFDSQFHAYFAGVGAYGNAFAPLDVVARGGDIEPARWVDFLRRAIGARIDAVLVQPSAGVARALITGDQTAIDDGARDVMASAGLAHVLSISGLHLTIVAGSVFAVLRLLLAGLEGLGLRLPAKRTAAVGGMLAAAFYYFISGGSVAALRSTLMILLVFGAVLAGRRAMTMRNVALAAVIVIATDPASVFRPGFQLSFAAVIALIGAWELARGRESRDRGAFAKVFAYFAGIAATSLVAGAATLLFSIYHFQQTSPLSVVGNLVSLPLVGFVTMPAAMIAAVAMPFGLEGVPLAIMGWSIDRMLDLATLVTAASAGLTASPLLAPLSLIIALAALAWFAFFDNRWRLLGPAVAVPLVVLLALDTPPDVLIADTTLAIAVRTAGGYDLVQGKAGSFATTVWGETLGEDMVAAGSRRCDAVACIVDAAAGFRIAIVSDPSGFAEECGESELVVTRGRAPSWCRSPLVIDEHSLARYGTTWLHWDAQTGRFDIRPALSGPGRPWRVAQP